MTAQQSVSVTFRRGNLWAWLAICSCCHSVNCHIYVEISEVSGTIVIKKCQLSVNANGRWLLTCLCTLTKHQITSSSRTDPKMNFKPIMALKCIRNENNIRIHHKSENKNAFKLSRAQYALFYFFFSTLSFWNIY